jgi:hypothetical protein
MHLFTGMRSLVRTNQLSFVALWLVGVTAIGGAQECPELPDVPAPASRHCSMLNLICKNQERQDQHDWEDRTRRFSKPMSYKDDASTAVQVNEYAIGGCRGSIVTLELTATHLRTLKYELLSPSGTTVATEQFTISTGTTIGKSVRLPESGFYTMRVTTTAAGEGRTQCTKAVKGTCTAQQSVTVYPTEFVVGFRGNAEAPAIRLGERAEGTVTQAQPLSRRIAVEAGQRLRVRVIVAGGQVACRAEAPDGSAIAMTSSASGCQGPLPETERDATYVIALTTTAPTPAGVSILAEAAGSEQNTLALDKETAGLFELTAPSGSPTLAQARAEWSVDVAQPGGYALTVVPSGLARLEVEVTFYNRTTEEIIVDRARVSGRKMLPLNIPASGRYALRVTPLTYDAPSAQGKAKYTLLFQKSGAK